MFATTTVKLRIRPSVVSQAATRGCDDSFETSWRTSGSLSASGGTAIDSGVPPSGPDGRSAATGAAGCSLTGAVVCPPEDEIDREAGRDHQQADRDDRPLRPVWHQIDRVDRFRNPDED